MFSIQNFPVFKQKDFLIIFARKLFPLLYQEKRYAWNSSDPSDKTAMKGLNITDMINSLEARTSIHR